MKTKKMVTIALLASMSYVLSYFSFPLIAAVPFLKIDFSDIPILIGTFGFGPVSGVLVAFTRSFLHYLFTGGELGIPIGDTAAFLASISYILPLYYWLKNREWSIKNKVIASALGTGLLTILLTILNWFVLIPAYFYLFNTDVGPLREYFLYGIVPFNLIKGVLVSLVFYPLYARLRPHLKRSQIKL